MKLAVTLLAHAHPDLVRDTVDSVTTWMTKNVLVVVDGAGWDSLKDADLGAEKIEGMRHGYFKSPYRLYTWALSKLYERHPDADWYVYMEYDCLVISNMFLEPLKRMTEQGVWCIGNDHRVHDYNFPRLTEITGHTPPKAHYLLGCCHFHSREFMGRLAAIDFFDKFLEGTSQCINGEFPHYNRHAFEEELFPTMAVALGGRIGEWACWLGSNETGNKDRWRGQGAIFPMRYRPDLIPAEICPSASLAHPVKSMDEIRQHYRRTRSLVRGRVKLC